MDKKKMVLLLVTATTLNVATAKVYAKEKKAGENKLVESNVYKEIKKGKVINITTNLRIRQGASTDSKVIGYLVNGEEFEIKAISGDWYSINANGKTGFINKDFVQELNTKKPEEDKKVNEVTKKGKVINVSTNLRIREKPNTSSDIVGYLLNGQTFDIKGNYGEWKYIKSEGKVGYIHKNYVNELDKEHPSEKPQVSEKPVIGKGKVINVTSNLRLRERPNTNSTIIGYLKAGDTFDIREKYEDWTYITYNGLNGHIHNAYIEELETNKPQKPDKPSTEYEDKIGQVINTNTRLRVRKEPNTISSIVAYLMPDEKLNIKAQLGDWYYTQLNGAEGYVFKDYVKIIKGDGNFDKDENLVGTVVNVTTVLRVREEASTNSKIVGHLQNGEKIKVISKSGHWYKINYNGSTGYVNKAYITIE